MEEHWKYIPNILNDKDNNVYKIILEEITPYLEQGTVKVFNNNYKERRLTTYFTTTNTKMIYSGRELKILHPPPYISSLIDKVNKLDFKHYSVNPVVFNAVFINWYRPPSMTDVPDKLGPHSDDEKYLTSPIILSLTYCEENGERAFIFHSKNTNKIVKEIELENGSGLFMLEQCQKLYKHSVADKKYNSKGRLVKSGRINATFRCVKT
jgi:alkylated DNA repair dioxygenase AlkB